MGTEKFENEQPPAENTWNSDSDVDPSFEEVESKEARWAARK